ncbi:hypothetical protein F2Q70_00002022 [Brassica cretica]|uniref:Uncharacterized protein n=1 Tax=Brassica cretica TaxID=69181 RepID=A0A8S9J0A3_BRACR|nr:hypothetical protein F2Q68_00025615 [Brassica cretica]KAF2575810.1 hypothetical protein F2Q70_00002022 [Brassica cretica]
MLSVTGAFAAAWLTPLTSNPPDMTWITRSWRGGEAGAAPLDFLAVSVLTSSGVDIEGWEISGQVDTDIPSSLS